MSTGASIPVLMYHSVGRLIPDWHWSILTVPAITFEDHLRALSRARYRSADLSRLHEHVSGGEPLPDRTVVLTFDDGYLDNWTYASPLLEKYGFMGIVCVNPDFVDPREIVRPTLADVWAGRAREGNLEVRGFMSWPEMRLATKRGVLSIQSHAMTHTWYAVGPEVVDFHHPGDGHYWLDWNAFPEEKPFYLRDPRASRVPWGTPVYSYAKSLEATRYFPDEREGAHCAAFVAERGGERFFERPGWRDELAGELERYRLKSPPNGRTETPEEKRARVEFELVESKRIIESKLGTRVDHVFWPGGGYDPEALDIAARSYRSHTWSGKDRWCLRNRPGEDPVRFTRRGVPFVETQNYRVHTGGRYLIWLLDEYRGVPLARRKRQVMKLLCLGGLLLGAWPARTEEKIPLQTPTK